ncbi:MAG: UDP-N-acetylmuramoyl-tripeptide--D-alanyl-D-alanine ligase [Halopseudomonas yangmingensis]
MIEAMRLSQLESALPGRLQGADATFDSVAIDTRCLQPGALFVALSGSRVDGHDFVGAAREAGAVAAMVEHPVDDPLPQLLVHDCEYALGQLGALARKAYGGPLVAITGSSGKTTVKEMLAAILATRGPVLATRGNLNNELGVPLTLLSLQPEHQFAVVEMGAAQLGDIARSMALAYPDLSILTNAGMAHVGRFGSPENIARAKGEIITALRRDGDVVLNLDSPWFETWHKTLGERRCHAFSLHNQTAELRAESVELDARGCPGFLLVSAQGSITVQLNLLGRHNIGNALAAAGAALALGCTLEQVRRGLANLQAVAGRAQGLAGRAGSLVIDDSYNANPGSVAAAIELLAGFDGTRILVLGDMGELGQWEQAAHREVGELARQRGLDGLYACGPLATLAAQAFGDGGHSFASREALAEALLQRLDGRTRVLVKGSRSAGMEQVVAQLTDNNKHKAD